MRIAPSGVAFTVLFVIFVSTTGTAAADEEEVELRGRRYFAAGQYKQALDIYVQLYVETLHPTYVRNIGRCYQNMGEPGSAIQAFREYLRKAENLDGKQRAEVEGFIVEMEELKRQREASHSPPSAPVVRQAPPPAPVFVSTPISGEPAPTRPGSSRRTAGYVVGAVGLASGAAALVHFLWNKGRNDKFQEEMSTDEALASSIHRASYVTVSLAVGSAALLATGIVLVNW